MLFALNMRKINERYCKKVIEIKKILKTNGKALIDGYDENFENEVCLFSYLKQYNHINDFETKKYKPGNLYGV